MQSPAGGGFFCFCFLFHPHKSFVPGSPRSVLKPSIYLMSALQYGIQISDTKGSCPRLSSKLILPPLKPIAYPASSIHSSENALQDGIISINKILTVRLHLVDFF